MEFRAMNMLSSIKTQVANISGNAMALSVETWNRFLAEHMGQGQGVVRGETFAFMGGMWDGLKKYLDTWRTDRAADPASPLIGDAGITERALTRDNALDVIGGVKEKIGL